MSCRQAPTINSSLTSKLSSATSSISAGRSVPVSTPVWGNERRFLLLWGLDDEQARAEKINGGHSDNAGPPGRSMSGNFIRTQKRSLIARLTRLSCGNRAALPFFQAGLPNTQSAICSIQYPLFSPAFSLSLSLLSSYSPPLHHILLHTPLRSHALLFKHAGGGDGGGCGQWHKMENEHGLRLLCHGSTGKGQSGEGCVEVGVGVRLWQHVCVCLPPSKELINPYFRHAVSFPSFFSLVLSLFCRFCFWSVMPRLVWSLSSLLPSSLSLPLSLFPLRAWF